MTNTHLQSWTLRGAALLLFHSAARLCSTLSPSGAFLLPAGFSKAGALGFGHFITRSQRSIRLDGAIPHTAFCGAPVSVRALSSAHTEDCLRGSVDMASGRLWLSVTGALSVSVSDTAPNLPQLTNPLSIFVHNYRVRLVSH